VIIRPIEAADTSAMLEIYRPFVESSAVSFEEELPTVADYAERVRKYVQGWGGLVAEVGGTVVGYAYGSAHRERAAYRWSVETTVYVSQGAQRKGVGRALYQRLLQVLRDAGYCNAFAGVALPNQASTGLHEAVGFKFIGSFPRVGYKFGEWRDVAWFHLTLRDAPIGLPAGRGADAR